MALKLILRNAVTASEEGAPAYNRASSTQGASATGGAVACSGFVSVLMGTWVSDVVDEAVTISGTVNCRVWGSESNGTLDGGFRCVLSVYRGGSKLSAFFTADMGAELTTSNAVRNWSGTPTSTALQVGDRIIVEMFAVNVVTPGTAMGGSGRTATLRYNGGAGADGDAYVLFTETVRMQRTRTVKSSGGDYTTLSAWEAGEQADLTSVNEIRRAECYVLTGNAADTTAANISGWTTDATRYIAVQPSTANRHAGTWSTTKYRLSVGASTYALSIAANHVRINGLQVERTAISATGYVVYVSGQTDAASDLHLSNILVKQLRDGTYYDTGIYVADAEANVKAWNCLVFGAGGVGSSNNAAFYIFSGTASAYSCTFIGGYRGAHRGGGTLTLKNCYASFDVAGGAAFGGTITETNCASSDGTAGGTAYLRNVAPDTDTFVNVSAGTEDYHLAADGASPLQGAGVDTSGESAPLNFTTDIDGDTRDAWSIGADDGVSSIELSGTSPSSVWTVAAIALVAGAVALSGTSPSTSWNTAGTFAATAALSGPSPAATWTPAAVDLTATAALAGTTPASVWSPAAIDLEPGAVALSGSSSGLTWQTAAIDLEAARQDLGGPSPAATWTVPGLALVPGTAALTGTSPAAAWSAAAIDLEPGSVAISGTSPTASWSVPVLALAPGSVALAGPSPSAIWQVPALSLVSEGGPQSLSGLSASANWLVPALPLAAGSVAVTGASPGATWAVPTLDLAARTALVGTRPSTSWLVPSLSLQAGTVALVGTSPEATWLVAAIDIYLSSTQALVGVSPQATWAVPSLRLGLSPRVLELIATVGATITISGTSNADHALLASARTAADLSGSTG